MSNPPLGLVETGGTDNLPEVTQMIGWEIFNSTDEDMEVLINAVQAQGADPVPTDSYLPQRATLPFCW
jgi:hypothetical protein